ncbi:MAG: diaminopimelate epimerase [Clostridia bacterium]|nr:diaminopimelate epimerase [Clostridia bacterium]
MKFTKMHGAGNDYIYVNCFEEEVNDPSAVAIKVSDRHFGIGSDGLVLIKPSEKGDFFMDMYNADGSRGKMCGNASRCVAKYVYDNGLTDKDEIALETLSGIKYIKIFTENSKAVAATVNMGVPELKAESIPVLFNKDTVVDEPLEVDSKTYGVTCVSMGNPHCVTYVEDTDSIEIEKIGPKFENHPVFPDRVNTEFVQIVDSKTMKMRVWERGSGETLACGTGACASVAASVLNGYFNKDEDIEVILLGGKLTIRWDSEIGCIFMTGPAETVCTGEIEV